MSQQCHVCGPVKHEAPTVMCAPCALRDLEISRMVEDLNRSGVAVSNYEGWDDQMIRELFERTGNSVSW